MWVGVTRRFSRFDAELVLTQDQFEDGLTKQLGVRQSLQRSQSALKLETDVESIARQAGQYKALQDRFRRIATIDALGDVGSAREVLEEAMASFDQVRAASITPPERYYPRAKKKIDNGDHSFAVDA